MTRPGMRRWRTSARNTVQRSTGSTSTAALADESREGLCGAGGGWPPPPADHDRARAAPVFLRREYHQQCWRKPGRLLWNRGTGVSCPGGFRSPPESQSAVPAEPGGQVPGCRSRLFRTTQEGVGRPGRSAPSGCELAAEILIDRSRERDWRHRANSRGSTPAAWTIEVASRRLLDHRRQQEVAADLTTLAAAACAGHTRRAQQFEHRADTDPWRPWSALATSSSRPAAADSGRPNSGAEHKLAGCFMGRPVTSRVGR